MSIWPFKSAPKTDNPRLAEFKKYLAWKHAQAPPSVQSIGIPYFVSGLSMVPGSWKPAQIPPQTSIPVVQPATAVPEITTMAITFKSVGHFFATAYTAIKNDLVKVEGTEATVEKVTEEIPVYGPLALTVEKAAYAALGELSAVLNAGGAAAAAKLNDAGLDSSVVATIQSLVAGVSNIATVAKAL